MKLSNQIDLPVLDDIEDIALALIRRQPIIWINESLFYWCIYAPIGLDVLIYVGRCMGVTGGKMYFILDMLCWVLILPFKH